MIPPATLRQRTRRKLHLCLNCPTRTNGGTYCEYHRRLKNIYQRERKRRVLGLKRRFLNAESYSYEVRE